MAPTLSCTLKNRNPEFTAHAIWPFRLKSTTAVPGLVIPHMHSVPGPNQTFQPGLLEISREAGGSSLSRPSGSSVLACWDPPAAQFLKGLGH